MTISTARKTDHRAAHGCASSAQSGATQDSTLPRLPVQARAVKKFHLILHTAARLFWQQGYETVSIREIARTAGVPVASVYQYFPSKAALVRQLWQGYTGALALVLEQAFKQLSASGTTPVNSQAVAGVIDMVVDHIDGYHQRHPEFVEVWRAIDSVPALRALDLEDSYDVARNISAVVQSLKPDVDQQLLFAQALILCETATSNVKRAQQFPPELHAQTINSLKVVLLRMTAELVS